MKQLERDIDSILISASKIQDEIALLAEKIAGDYEGRDLTVIAVLSGSIVFLADLIRHLPLRLRIKVISAASYGASTTSSGEVQVLRGLDFDFEGEDVLIVDDILDTGRTLRRIREEIERGKPSSIRSCVLLDKAARRVVDIQADYVAFEIPDEFVVGYGLDFNGYYRNLPYIAKLRQEAIVEA
ncbi:MAG: hypoxanthine phosphoribosyltransferase [Planctomycetota bacterium]